MKLHLNLAASSAVVAAAAFAFPLTSATFADVAVRITGGTGGAAAANSAHGWEFTVTESLTLTHLGLWDEGMDGFNESHPIGLFRLNDNALLTSGTMSPGVIDPLEDGFRYIDVADVVLDAGVNYVVSYYTANANSDVVITTPENELFAGEVNWVSGRWQTGTGGLVIPANSTGADRYGPNFKFDTGGEPEYLLTIDGDCPGRLEVAWDNATPNVQQAIVIGNTQGSTTIPNAFPCAGTQLGVAGNVMLVDPPGFFGTQSGSGIIRGNAGSGACGRYLQLVEGGSCNTSNVVQIP